jgi:UDP-N-acetyl-D-glucosamine dehydrogenase
LNEAGKAVKGSQVLVLGIAYKRDVSDIREAPALDILHLLQDKGANIAYHDPHVPVLQADGLALESQTDLKAALKQADCVLIATDHSAYAWDLVRTHSQCIVDTRHVL